MSTPLIIALNIGVASLLALGLIALMLAPKRLRPHHHPHLDLPGETPPSAEPVEHRRARAERRQASGRAIPITKIG
jgi:hypothetical protein